MLHAAELGGAQGRYELNHSRHVGEVVVDANLAVGAGCSFHYLVTLGDGSAEWFFDKNVYAGRKAAQRGGSVGRRGQKDMNNVGFSFSNHPFKIVMNSRRRQTHCSGFTGKLAGATGVEIADGHQRNPRKARNRSQMGTGNSTSPKKGNTKRIF